jgi:hypothetical protein
MPTPNLPAQDHLPQLLADLQSQVKALQNPYQLDTQANTVYADVYPTPAGYWVFDNTTYPGVTVQVGPSGLLLVSITAEIELFGNLSWSMGDFGFYAFQEQTGWQLGGPSGGGPAYYIESAVYGLASTVSVYNTCSGQILLTGVPQGPVGIQCGGKALTAREGFKNMSVVAQAIGNGLSTGNEPPLPH